MQQQELVSQFEEELLHSIADEALMTSEKKEIKQLLLRFGPDKDLCNVLRAKLFEVAHQKINQTNYFAIIQWCEDLNKVILSTQKDEQAEESVYFSPGDSCLNAILQRINSAYKKIDICLFTISDNRITNALISKHKAAVPIHIITDNDKIFDKGSDISTIASAGIPIRIDNTDNHMHHKFALFDEKNLLTGSYNWTRSAEQYNHENIIISNSPKMIRAFSVEFDRLWNELTPYEEN